MLAPKGWTWRNVEIIPGNKRQDPTGINYTVFGILQTLWVRYVSDINVYYSSFSCIDCNCTSKPELIEFIKIN